MILIISNYKTDCLNFNIFLINLNVFYFSTDRTHTSKIKQKNIMLGDQRNNNDR